MTTIYSQVMIITYFPCGKVSKVSLIDLNISQSPSAHTDTSSHTGLFVDGRLAGSSCLVGYAGVRPLPHLDNVV